MAEPVRKGAPDVVPVIAPGHTFASITDKVTSVVLTRHTPIAWYVGLLLASGLVGLLFVSLGYLVYEGAYNGQAVAPTNVWVTADVDGSSDATGAP